MGGIFYDLQEVLTRILISQVSITDQIKDEHCDKDCDLVYLEKKLKFWVRAEKSVRKCITDVKQAFEEAKV